MSFQKVLTLNFDRFHDTLQLKKIPSRDTILVTAPFYVAGVWVAPLSACQVRVQTHRELGKKCYFFGHGTDYLMGSWPDLVVESSRSAVLNV